MKAPPEGLADSPTARPSTDSWPVHLVHHLLQGLKRPDAPLIFQVGQQVEISVAWLAKGQGNARHQVMERSHLALICLQKDLHPMLCLSAPNLSFVSQPI